MHIYQVGIYKGKVREAKEILLAGITTFAFFLECEQNVQGKERMEILSTPFLHGVSHRFGWEYYFVEADSLASAITRANECVKVKGNQ